MTDEPYLSEKELAEYLHTRMSAICIWSQRGQIQAVKVLTMWRCRRPSWRSALLRADAVTVGARSGLEPILEMGIDPAKVYLVHRRDELRASKIMAQRAIDHPKIEVLWNTTVDEVLGDDLVTGIQVTNTQTGEQSILPVEGFFLAIGHDPNTNIFQDQLELDVAGYVVTEAGSTTTSVAGVFAAGDVVDHYYQQAVTAAGMGCQAAIDVEHWLDRIES